MNIVHYGRNKGVFLHEIPAYSQWVSGDTPIVVPKGSKATLYVSLLFSNCQLVLPSISFQSF